MRDDNPFEVLGVSETATDEQVRNAWRRKIQQSHPDVAGERFTDQASRVNAAYQQIATEDARASYRQQVSEAGPDSFSCPDCGAQNLSRDQLFQHLLAHQGQARDRGCQFCYRAPAEFVRYTGVTGFLLGRQHWELEAKLCKSCGRGAFRAAQAKLLTTGWWSIFAAISTPFLLLANIGRVSNHSAGLKNPQPSDPELDRIARGKPVLLRPSVLIVLAVFLGLGVWLGLSSGDYSTARPVGPTTTRQTVAPVQPTTPSTLPQAPELAWAVGDCVRIEESSQSVYLVRCSPALADGRIADIVFAESQCPANTLGTIDLRDEVGNGNYGCVVEY